MIVGNYISYTISGFYEIVNVITNFLGHPLSVKCDFWVGLAWLWNGLNYENCGLFESNYHKRNNSFVQISIFVYSWLILK